MSIIQNWTDHNARLFKLNPRDELCRKIYSSSPFSRSCNTKYQFGCYKAGVSNPFDIISDPPCINYTQIGNDKEDCYLAYDTMLGFNFRCPNDIMD
ncbi:unnamed protein product [Adineta steineri]|uniref:Uncharacterized protein n=1 Tax=Adineta steineri TaxID=433720 RepID=A0A813WU72_9BILA|nr:unnamed protein product [Adineta steineri]CAF1061304.1 unnamed protein product [Adineta steineri]CAF4083796.1 unnamed protein product [Adineta steineri]CAF4136919.1 unnamed protein product [Adineta steineri]